MVAGDPDVGTYPVKRLVLEYIAATEGGIRVPKFLVNGIRVEVLRSVESMYMGRGTYLVDDRVAPSMT